MEEVPRFKYREFVPNFDWDSLPDDVKRWYPDTAQTTATDVLNGSNALDEAMLDALGLDRTTTAATTKNIPEDFFTSPPTAPHPGPIQTMGTELQGRQILEEAVRLRSVGLPQGEIEARVQAMYSGLNQPGMTNQKMGEFITTWQAPQGGVGSQFNVQGDPFSGPSAGMPGLPTGS